MILKIGDTEIECTSTDKFTSKDFKAFLAMLNELTPEDIEENQKVFEALSNSGDRPPDDSLCLIGVVERVRKVKNGETVRIDCGLGMKVEALIEANRPPFVRPGAKVKVPFSLCMLGFKVDAGINSRNSNKQ